MFRESPVLRFVACLKKVETNVYRNRRYTCNLSIRMKERRTSEVPICVSTVGRKVIKFIRGNGRYIILVAFDYYKSYIDVRARMISDGYKEEDCGKIAEQFCKSVSFIGRIKERDGLKEEDSDVFCDSATEKICKELKLPMKKATKNTLPIKCLTQLKKQLRNK